MYSQFTLKFALTALLAFGAVTMGTDAFAQGPATTKPLTRNVTREKAKVGPKFANPDLAVVEFMGVFGTTDYILGGKVKNVGNAKSQPRTLQIYVVLNGGFGNTGSFTLLRTLTVPALKAGESYSTGTLRIPTRQVPGPATAQFLMKLAGSDINTSNDWKQTIVSTVR